MRIRTLENLSDSLASELSWRKKELAVLRSIIRSQKPNESKYVAMIRSGVTILYAHWEGFIKAGAENYLEYISNKGLKLKNLQIPFRVLRARSLISGAIDSSRIEKMINVAEFFLSKQDEKCQIPYKTIIKTRSNLSSSVLKEIMTILNLDYDPYATKEKLIDKSLLYFRNNIAHGKGFYPSREQTDELFENIIELMDLFKTQIENAAATQGYKI